MSKENLKNTIKNLELSRTESEMITGGGYSTGTCYEGCTISNCINCVTSGSDVNCSTCTMCISKIFDDIGESIVPGVPVVPPKS